MVAEVDACTAEVPIEKVALLDPEGTVTVAGTVAAGLLLERLTTAPVPEAGPVSVTVPCELEPPTTEVGLSTRLETASGGGTVSEVVRVPLASAAERVTEVAALTFDVVTGKFALVVPPGTVTLAGTEATPGLLLERATVVPPAGAAIASVTVPCAVLPPATVEGLTDSESELGIWYPVMLVPTSSLAPHRSTSTGPPESRKR